MAYISQKCVNCEEHTRRCVRRFSACDENGEPFFCPMYICGNRACSVNIERLRGERQIRMNRSERPFHAAWHVRMSDSHGLGSGRR